MIRKTAVALVVATLVASLSVAAYAGEGASVSASVTVNPLAISLVLSAGEVGVGGSLTATATVHNLGSTALTGVSVTLRTDPTGVAVEGGETRSVGVLQGGGTAQVSWPLCAVEAGNYLLLGSATTGVFESESSAQMLTVTSGGAKCFDSEAPSLVVPTGMIVNATTPAGASVSFAASATDDTDPNPIVGCTPASGTTFAIALTTVRCKATDVSGNSSQASFTVTVKGAGAQIVDLIDKTLAFMDQTPLEATLKAQLAAAAAALVSKRPMVVCKLLTLYITAVRGAPAKAGLSAAEKSQLVEDATRIKGVVGGG